jgi:hypothetical protein
MAEVLLEKDLVAVAGETAAQAVERVEQAEAWARASIQTLGHSSSMVCLRETGLRHPTSQSLETQTWTADGTASHSLPHLVRDCA